MAGISIRNLVKSYGSFTVVPDLSLEIASPAEAREILHLKGGDRVGF